MDDLSSRDAVDVRVYTYSVDGLLNAIGYIFISANYFCNVFVEYIDL